MATHDIVMSAAGGTAGDVAYIDDCFSTYLYSSTSGTDVTINNGIDLATEGGMVWVKSRTTGSTNNYIVDTVRGSSSGDSKKLITNLNNVQDTGANLDYMVFNNNGFTAKAVSGGGELGTNTYYGDFVSWTFRKQPKFFDVVTYTGNGVAGRQIAHSLTSAPGCIIVKNTNVARDWAVWHRSLADGTYLKLNTTDAAITNTSYQVFGDSSGQTSTVFTVGKVGAAGVNGLTNANASGETYVAYLFAHDAGGFGTAGTDNVISCGTFTTDGSKNITPINLGYEPQWMLIRRTDSDASWIMVDNMRCWGSGTTNSAFLFPNYNIAEDSGGDSMKFTSTGLGGSGYPSANATYIYIAIRRPMKPPTTGTEVFAPIVRAGTNSNTIVTTPGFVNDAVLSRRRVAAQWGMFDRLRGAKKLLRTALTNEEITDSLSLTKFDVMNGYGAGSDDSTATINYTGNYATYAFRRAPGFFDVVCFTPTGSAHMESHNLTTAPELIIGKSRSDAFNWYVYAAPLGNTKAMYLNTDDSPITGTYLWNNTSPTSTAFSLGASGLNSSASTAAIAYLFATVAGVSKVGSYTGTGTTQQINCGFSGGARFVLIKRTDSTGDWYVWDTARGIVSGNDPYFLLNSTAAEVTSTDYIDPSSSGFEISSTAPDAINASGGTFIYLAIA